MTEASQKSHVRKHFFINRAFQLRYMFQIVIILLVVMGASLASMYFGIWGSVLKELSNEGIRNQLIVANRIFQYEKARAIETGDETSGAALKFIKETELLSQKEREVFQEILYRTNQKLLIYLIPLLVFIAWGTIFLSHKIAGPLYRFDQCFKKIKNGDLTTRAHLRKKDEAQWLSKSFNEMATSLDEDIGTLKNKAAEIASTGPDNSKGLLEKILSRFKTSK